MNYIAMVKILILDKELYVILSDGVQKIELDKIVIIDEKSKESIFKGIIKKD